MVLSAKKHGMLVTVVSWTTMCSVDWSEFCHGTFCRIDNLAHIVPTYLTHIWTLPPGSWWAPGDMIISPVLCQLHWLPVRQRVLVKQLQLPLIVSWMCSSLGDRTFAAAGRQDWNSLPPHLRRCRLSYSHFRWLLKHFYSDSEATHVQCEPFLTAPNRNILTYLLMMHKLSSHNGWKCVTRVSNKSSGFLCTMNFIANHLPTEQLSSTEDHTPRSESTYITQQRCHAELYTQLTSKPISN